MDVVVDDVVVGVDCEILAEEFDAGSVAVVVVVVAAVVVAAVRAVGPVVAGCSSMLPSSSSYETSLNVIDDRCCSPKRFRCCCCCCCSSGSSPSRCTIARSVISSSNEAGRNPATAIACACANRNGTLATRGSGTRRYSSNDEAAADCDGEPVGLLLAVGWATTGAAATIRRPPSCRLRRFVRVPVAVVAVVVVASIN